MDILGGNADGTLVRTGSQQLRLTKLRLPGTSVLGTAETNQSQLKEQQIRQYCLNVINLKRDERRREVLAKARERTKGAADEGAMEDNVVPVSDI